MSRVLKQQATRVKRDYALDFFKSKLRLSAEERLKALYQHVEELWKLVKERALRLRSATQIAQDKIDSDFERIIRTCSEFPANSSPITPPTNSLPMPSYLVPTCFFSAWLGSQIRNLLTSASHPKNQI
jgi:hypothetical protein